MRRIRKAVEWVLAEILFAWMLWRLRRTKERVRWQMTPGILDPHRLTIRADYDNRHAIPACPLDVIYGDWEQAPALLRHAVVNVADGRLGSVNYSARRRRALLKATGLPLDA